MNGALIAIAIIAIIIVIAVAYLALGNSGTPQQKISTKNNSSTNTTKTNTITQNAIKSTTKSTLNATSSTLTVAAPIPSASTISQGQSVTLTDFGASGGTAPYEYQWLEESPGSTTFSAMPSLSGGSTSYTFTTTSSTPTGTYIFELRVTDSENPAMVTTSNLVSINVTASATVHAWG